MNKRLLLVILMIFLVTIFFCGCQEKEAITSQNSFEGITFESSVAELVDASLDIHEENNILTRVDVKFLFGNIAGKDLELYVTVEYYDKSDNLLATGGPKIIILPEGYTEQVILPANIISYSGEKVSEIEYVKIIAKE
jgi:hypothetical protein